MGAGVFADSRYGALASRAAAELGGGASLARGILAQFACEKADGWPPQDNNPGNVHVAALASIGISAPSGVGDGGACASFSSPEAGTDAMVALLTGASRYRSAVASARANNGAGYLAAVTAAGWGTSYSCAAGYYGAGAAATAAPPSAMPGTVPSSSSPPSSSGGSSASLNVTQQTLAALGIPTDPNHLLTNLDIWKITMQALGQNVNAPINPGNQIYQGYLANLSGKTVGQLSSIAASGQTLSQPDIFSGISAAIAGLPAALGAALGGLLVNGAVLILILILAYKGLEGLLEQGPATA